MIYKFKVAFTKLGVGTAPSSAPVCTVVDADDNILASAQATVALANLPGVYLYSYTGASGLDLVALFHTTDATVDQQDLYALPITINILSLDKTWIDPEYDNVYESDILAFQPCLCKQDEIYYIFYEAEHADGIPGKYTIEAITATTLAGPWSTPTTVLEHSTNIGDPDYYYVADPSVLYIPWATHHWHMWFDQCSVVGSGYTTIGHAYADDPLGPWTKQNTNGTTDIVIAIGTAGEFDDLSCHAPECYIYNGIVHCVYQAIGTGHSGYDPELAIASDDLGLGTEFTKWGACGLAGTLVDPDRMQSIFQHNDVLYVILEGLDRTHMYWMASYNGGKNWENFGTSLFPFHSFLIDSNLIYGITHRHGSRIFPMKIYYIDLTTELDDPDRYKANVSSLALEATLTAMKGAGWTDETLVSLMTSILSRSSHSAADVWSVATRTLTSFGTLIADIWAYATRTLTQSAAVSAAAVTGDDITIVRGDTVSISLTGLGSLAGMEKLYFSVKDNYRNADSESIIMIEAGTGLVYINGAIATTPANGSLIIDDESAGDITITLKAVESAKLVCKPYYCDIQIITASGVFTLHSGNFVVVGDITRTTE